METISRLDNPFVKRDDFFTMTGSEQAIMSIMACRFLRHHGYKIIDEGFRTAIWRDGVMLGMAYQSRMIDRLIVNQAWKQWLRCYFGLESW